ncbi:MAG: hypothetical protein WCG31_04065 [Deltaproteobacteria bacterium]
MRLTDVSIPAVFDILAATLPPDERSGFKQWYDEISKTDFWRVLPAFFSDDEVKSAIADYIADQLGHLEHFCGVSIHALIKVDGRTFQHGCFNEEYGC